jgi:hypothetical protein
MVRMKIRAMRLPSPVLTIAREMKNAAKTNQTIGSAYPARALATGKVPVMASAETPIKTIAPPGTGRTMDPIMVATKIAKRCQDWLVIPEGTGMNKTAQPESNTIAHLTRRLLNERC